MTTDPIAAKAEALWAKRPELRPLGLKYALSPTTKEMGWWLDYYIITDDDAHMLIEAACWRALPNKSWEQVSTGDYVVKHDVSQDWHVVSDGKSLTEALIAACMEAEQ